MEGKPRAEHLYSRDQGDSQKEGASSLKGCANSLRTEGMMAWGENEPSGGRIVRSFPGQFWKRIWAGGGERETGA